MKGRIQEKHPRVSPWACPMCSREYESVAHFLLHCKLAPSFSNRMWRLANIAWLSRVSLEALWRNGTAAAHPRMTKDQCKAAINAVTWSIWIRAGWRVLLQFRRGGNRFRVSMRMRGFQGNNVKSTKIILLTPFVLILIRSSFLNKIVIRHPFFKKRKKLIMKFS